MGRGLVNLQALLGPELIFFGSFPELLPSNSSQMALTLVAHVPVIVEVSPKLELMPVMTLPSEALTFLTTTFRLPCDLQLPQLR